MNEWYRALSALETDPPPLSDAEQQRIDARVREKMETTRKKHRVVPFLIAAVLALTACTATVVNVQDWFAFVSSPNSEEISQQLFSDMGTVIGQTVKDRKTGVSMTLDGCLFDGERLALAVTVKGMDLEGYNKMYASAEPEEMWILSEGAVARWKEIMTEQAPDAGKTEAEEWEQQFRETMITMGGRPDLYARSLDGEKDTLHLEIVGVNYQNFWRGGDTMEVHLKNVLYRDELLIPGDFTFTFQMPELSQDIMRWYRGELKVENENIAMTVTDVRVTPSTVYMDTIVSEGYHERNRNENLSAVRLKDGQVWYFTGNSLHDQPESGPDGCDLMTYGGGYARWQYVAPAEVEAICLGYDTWIELSELEEYTPEE